MRALRLLTWLSALSALACGEAEPRTQLIIWLRAEAAVAEQLAQVRIALYGDSEAKREARFDIAHGSPQKGEVQLPFSFGIALGRSYSFDLVARGYASRAEDAPLLVERRTRVSFMPRVTREVTVMLGASDRVCNGAEPPGCTMTQEPPDAGPPPPSDTGSDAQHDDDAGPVPDPCLKGPGADVCDPVSQCGCEGTAHCQVDDDRGACALGGERKEGEQCARNRECALGLSCLSGACRSTCRSHGDCDMPSQCVRRKGASFGFCASACAKPGAAPCANGLTCSPLRADTVQDSFCVRLEDPCSSTDDEVCDEPGRGTGFCAAKSDANDCCFEPRPKGWCDLVTQCGCPKDKACHPTGMLSMEVRETGCRDQGSLPLGSVCTQNTQCQRGAGCRGGICKRYCSDAGGGCPSGKCLALVEDVADNEGVGACSPTCDWNTQKECLPGTVCAQLRTGLTCYVQPEVCPYLDDKVCDEPTRLCREGTDSDSDCMR